MAIDRRDQYVYFQKSVVSGVEIKRCKGSPYDYKPHVHNELSLGYILSGSTELTLRGETIRYEAGDGVIIPPLTSHRCAPNDINDWEYVMLFIHPGFYADAVRFQKPKKLQGAAVGKLQSLISRLLSAIEPGEAEAVLLELLLEFGDEALPGHPEADTGAIRKIHAYIVEHLHEYVTLDHLEEISGLNKFTLIRNFKKAYVATPAAFHLQCRVAEAKRLLDLHGNVFDICSDLNFYDQAHFIREFRKMYGITPAAYREQLLP